MVKNLSGGNRSKCIARKNFIKTSNVLQISEDPDEIYAQVIKMCGGKICFVIDLNGREMICHIRGKFSGKGKRDNYITVSSWILVALREWENKDKVDSKLNCDLICVYNDSDKIRLKTMVNLDWKLFTSNDMKQIGAQSTTLHANEDDNVVFMNEKTQEYQELIEKQLETDINTNTKLSSIIEDDDDDEVCFEDI